MGEQNYKKLGFKCGIEIHQQLDTHKLFCNCPSIIINHEPDFIVKRFLRASEGETGEIDLAAKHEIEKGKQYVYHGFNENTCLVELDEEPPHSINPEALETALIISKLLDAKIIDEIQVMRKTVVDGSNTAGFQRTALIAINGHIMTSKGRVGIDFISLEEDSSKIIKRTSTKDTYNLSRSGIPLIEIGTDASIKDPDHAKEVASKLGMILRSTRVKRGLGTIRQDVNLSITKGERVEIKGFQDLKSMPKIINKEIERQISMIKKGKKVSKDVRKAESDLSTTYLRPIPGSARMYPETDVPPIIPDLKNIKLPRLLTEKSDDLKKLGISKELADTLVKKKDYDLFDVLTKKFKNIEPKFIAATLINSPKEIKKRYNVEPKFDREILEKIFAELDESKISKEAVFELLVEAAQGKKLDFSKYELMSNTKLEKEIKQIIKDNKGLPINALIGKTMGKLRGKADGRKIVEMLKREVS